MIVESGCIVDWGQGNIDADPNFVSLGSLSNNTMVTTGDYHLLDDSPCIDSGDPDFVAEPSETDIDGHPRISGKKIDIGADEFVPSLTVDVKVTPRTLSLHSSGEFISCTIQLPSEYSIENIDKKSIVLNGAIQPESYNDGKGVKKLIIKFDRSETQKLLKDLDSGDSVSLTITGQLVDGTKFVGSDTIRILSKKK